MEVRGNDLGRVRGSQGPDGAAAVVKSDGLPKLSAREGFDFQNVVEKFNKLVCICSNVLNVIVLFDAIEVTANLLNAAPRWPDDTIVVLKILNKESFSRRRVDLIAAVGHWLATARLA